MSVAGVQAKWCEKGPIRTDILGSKMLGECGEGGHMSLGWLYLELCEAGSSVKAWKH